VIVSTPLKISKTVHLVFSLLSTLMLDGFEEVPSYKEQSTQQIKVISYVNFPGVEKTCNKLSMSSPLPFHKSTSNNNGLDFSTDIEIYRGGSKIWAAFQELPS